MNLRRILISFVKYKRKKLGLTQEGLSKLAGISRVALANYETSKNDLKFETLINILKAMDVNQVELGYFISKYILESEE